MQSNKSNRTDVPCKNGKFLCTTCGKILRSKYALSIHMDGHSGVKRFSCRICEKKFRHQSALFEHLKLHNGIKPFDCDVCGRKFIRKTILETHMKTHNGNQTYECKFCFSTFSNSDCFKKHIVKHNINNLDNVDTSVNVCDAEIYQTISSDEFLNDKDGELNNFVNNSEINDPNCVPLFMNLMYSEETNCTSKKKSFCAENISKSSKKKDVQDKQVKCNLCGKKLKSLESFYTHSKIHTGCTINCGICNKDFTSRQCLITHMRIHTGDRPFECHVCGKSFSAKRTRDDHMITHTSEKPYKCSVCNMTFRFRSSLNKHKKLHAKKINVDLNLKFCDVCGQEFFKKDIVISHMKEHAADGIYIHICEICGKLFKSRKMFGLHIQKNHEIYDFPNKPKHQYIDTDRNHECDTCGKCFKKSGHLKVHTRIHTAVKPFKCDVCLKAFTSKCDLTRHFRIHTGETPYQCRICEMEFSLRRQYNCHMKKKH